MKQKLLGAGVLVLLLSVFGVGLWRYSLTWGCQWSIHYLVEYKDPLALVDGFIGEMKNDIQFSKKMRLVEKKSFWPANTKYDIFWNGITINSGGQTLTKNTWVDVVIWNGYGITKVEIYGLDTQKLLYPNQNTRKPSVSANGVTAQIEQYSEKSPQNKNYWHVYITSLTALQENKKLRLVVTDISGNVTEAIVETASIPRP